MNLFFWLDVMKLDGYYKHRKGFLFEAIKCQTFYVPNDTPNAVLYHKTMVDTTKQQNHFQTAATKDHGAESWVCDVFVNGALLWPKTSNTKILSHNPLQLLFEKGSTAKLPLPGMTWNEITTHVPLESNFIAGENN